VELFILAAPILVAIPVLVALLLSVYGMISVPRWTWVGFIAFALLACAPFAALVVHIVATPLPWPQPKYGGLVVAPVAFVLAILLVKRRVRITTHRRAVVVWVARAGAALLGVIFAAAWLFDLSGYYVDKVTTPPARDDRPISDLAHTDREIAASPDNPALRIRRAGERARFLKDRPGAMEDLEHYRTLTRDVLGYYITKARLLHFYLDDCTAAIAEYDAALRLAPTKPVSPENYDSDSSPITAAAAEIHAERAQCYQVLGRTEAAIDAYNAAIRLDSRQGAWWRERGELLLRQGCRDILHSHTLPGGYVPRSARSSVDERDWCKEYAPP
jgi:hypothetical protein